MELDSADRRVWHRKQELVPECPQQWRIDVNDKYQAAVGVVISLASASMILPILFLKDVVRLENRALAHVMNWWTYGGWSCLAVSILSGILYHYCSAKWVKLSWRRSADMFGVSVNDDFVELCLDVTYFVMMVGFVLGLGCMVLFMARFTHLDHSI